MSTAVLPRKAPLRGFFRQGVRIAMRTFLLYLMLGTSLLYLFHRTASASVSWESVTAAPNVTGRVGAVDDAADALSLRLRLIGQAEKSLINSTYAFYDDDSGKEVLAAPVRGGRVKLIIDGLPGAFHSKNSVSFRALAGFGRGH